MSILSAVKFLLDSSVKTLKGSQEYKFEGMISQNKDEAAKVFQTQIVPLLEHFSRGGNSSFISYGQKGLGKSEFLSSLKGGLILEAMRYLLDGPGSQPLPQLTLSIVHISSSRVICISSSRFWTSWPRRVSTSWMITRTPI